LRGQVEDFERELSIAQISVRKKILDIAFTDKLNGSHLGGALSSVEIVTTVYLKFMHEGSRFILSKGHAALVLYATLNYVGRVSDLDLSSYHKLKSKLLGHPVKDRSKGIEFSTGSLGMGLSLACGLALLKKLNHESGRIFCLVGDGELNEGSNWESIQFAAHHQLGNLICLVDSNSFQQTGNTKLISSSGELINKFKAFNWNCFEINGHCSSDITDAILKVIDLKNSLPSVLICKTIKGKGIPQIENDNRWHHSLMSDAQFEMFRESIY
jgi:transketolase